MNDNLYLNLLDDVINSLITKSLENQKKMKKEKKRQFVVK